ncbi:MAG: hypothetical protein ACJ8GJ_19370 [Vitreoscilla sp.]
MRAPPPVEFTSVPGRAWRAALSLLVGASVAAPLAWALPYLAALDGQSGAGALGSPAVQAAVALSVAAITVGACWLAQGRSTAIQRTLRWDGQEWVLAAGDDVHSAERGGATLMLDLGPWMLVRFLPHMGMGSRIATWLPLSAAGEAARWAALRGALWNWRA